MHVARAVSTEPCPELCLSPPRAGIAVQTAPLPLTCGRKTSPVALRAPIEPATGRDAAFSAEQDTSAKEKTDLEARTKLSELQGPQSFIDLLNLESIEKSMLTDDGLSPRVPSSLAAVMRFDSGAKARSVHDQSTSPSVPISQDGALATGVEPKGRPRYGKLRGPKPVIRSDDEVVSVDLLTLQSPIFLTLDGLC